MPSPDFDPARFSGKVPLFPLPNVVLFPRAILPLHVFEPRYRAMTEAALEGEGLIAMAHLEPGWKGDYYGNPPVRRVVGVGKIVRHERQSDGKYNLILHGVARAGILEEVAKDPFRLARVELLEDRPEQGVKYERLRRLLLQFYNQMLRDVLKGAQAPAPSDLPLGPLCDLLAAVVSFDPPLKQAILEDLDVGARCDRLVSLLEASRESGPSRRPWPPELSAN